MPFSFLDLLFPRRSLLGEEGVWITEAEREDMQLTPSLIGKKELMKRGLYSLDSVIAAGSYDSSPLLKKAIRSFKYKRIEDLGTDLGARMSEAMHGLLLPPQELRMTPPILCPVPLHWIRRFQRGFNQSLVLAEVIGSKRGLMVRELLKRTRRTGHQAHRKRHERLTVLKGAFSIRSLEENPPSFVLLVDDLFTTGATLNECAKTLKKSGVKFVCGIVAALG